MPLLFESVDLYVGICILSLMSDANKFIVTERFFSILFIQFTETQIGALDFRHAIATNLGNRYQTGVVNRSQHFW